MLVLLSLGSAILPIALFAMMARGSAATALLGALVLACVAGGVSAVGAVATALFGGLTPFLAQLLIDATGWPLVPGAMIAVVAVVVLPVLLRLPETAPRRA